jgi:hypothetical protein
MLLSVLITYEQNTMGTNVFSLTEDGIEVLHLLLIVVGLLMIICGQTVPALRVQWDPFHRRQQLVAHNVGYYDPETSDLQPLPVVLKYLYYTMASLLVWLSLALSALEDKQFRDDEVWIWLSASGLCIVMGTWYVDYLCGQLHADLATVKQRLPSGAEMMFLEARVLPGAWITAVGYFFLCALVVLPHPRAWWMFPTAVVCGGVGSWYICQFRVGASLSLLKEYVGYGLWLVCWSFISYTATSASYVQS